MSDRIAEAVQRRADGADYTMQRAAVIEQTRRSMVGVRGFALSLRSLYEFG